MLQVKELGHYGLHGLIHLSQNAMQVRKTQNINICHFFQIYLFAS